MEIARRFNGGLREKAARVPLGTDEKQRHFNAAPMARNLRVECRSSTVVQEGM
jgi:hypothetical protein